MSLKQYPPIKSWVLIGFIAIILFIACDFFGKKFGDWAVLEKRVIQALPLLENTLNSIKSFPEKTQIVVVGSSLVGDGIACTSEYGDQYSDVCLTKLYLNSEIEIIKIFDAIGTFDSLLIYPPDILLIQIDQLVYDFEKSDLEKLYFRGAYFLNNLKSYISNNSENKKHLDYCGRISAGTIADTSIYEYNKMGIVSFNDKKYLHNKLETLSKRGVKIYLIHVPRPAKTELLLPQHVQPQEFNQLIKEYQKLIHCTYLEYPQKLNFKYFLILHTLMLGVEKNILIGCIRI